MTQPLTVSVVVVSQQRPALLRRCVLGLSQMFYRPFEVVVVADGAGRAALSRLPQAARAKVVAFDESNIAQARNLGIEAASGEVIAFIDDDAVPEPTWLSYLVVPFARPEVMAVAGYVRGRNGISWQTRAQAVDQTGQCHPLEVEDVRPTLLCPSRGRAIKTEGTNMAIRRSCLCAMGGFDPRYHFYLDDTDLNMRLAEEGHVTAIAPRAEVHHGVAASARRRADRVPADLRQIGASWAVFLARHCDPARRGQAWSDIVQSERRRVLDHMVAGRLEPRDVRRLMAGLQAGFDAGKVRTDPGLPPLEMASGRFQPLVPVPPQGSVVRSGRVWSRAALRRQARHDVSTGLISTVLRLSPTALFHHVRFTQDGYWEQTGGLFGKSERTQGLFRPWTHGRRIVAETARMKIPRGLALLTDRKSDMK